MKTTFILKSLIGAFFIFLAYGSGEREVINYQEFTNDDFSELINEAGNNSVLYFNQKFKKDSKKNLYGGATKYYKVFDIELEIHSNGTAIYNKTQTIYGESQSESVKGKWNIVQTSSISDGCTGGESKCYLNLRFENGKERNPVLFFDEKAEYSGLVDCNESTRETNNISDWDDVNRGYMVIPFNTFYN